MYIVQGIEHESHLKRLLIIFFFLFFAFFVCDIASADIPVVKHFKYSSSIISFTSFARHRRRCFFFSFFSFFFHLHSAWKSVPKCPCAGFKNYTHWFSCVMLKFFFFYSLANDCLIRRWNGRAHGMMKSTVINSFPVAK